MVVISILFRIIWKLGSSFLDSMDGDYANLEKSVPIPIVVSIRLPKPGWCSDLRTPQPCTATLCPGGVIASVASLNLV